ncbi:hypothetical protein PHMEG_00018760 [Phytophthora megakarya]|uniref:Uncharacterized protein n=1 Tax=Phytophthora megakarya TaxID=4795 RepID=A0A225VU39_9STRA|nr:hypothetical protein PHMEG_00018760 [Phytophthora megakarya]
MLALEEQELLGTAMVTRLTLAHVRPREWSESDASRPEPKRSRGSTDCNGVTRNSNLTRVWGGPIPDVVGTSSLASGDAPTLTPDENMSSAGGGSQGPLGPPGMEPSTALVGVYMVTTGSGTGPSNVAEQPTIYVPVAEYPPGSGRKAPTSRPDSDAADDSGERSGWARRRAQVRRPHGGSGYPSL